MATRGSRRVGDGRFHGVVTEGFTAMSFSPKTGFTMTHDELCDGKVLWDLNLGQEYERERGHFGFK